MEHKTILTETNHMRKLMGLSLHEQNVPIKQIIKQLDGFDVNEVIKQLEQQKISSEEKRKKDLRIDKNAQEILRNFYDALWETLKIETGKFFEDNEEELNNAAEEITKKRLSEGWFDKDEDGEFLHKDESNDSYSNVDVKKDVKRIISFLTPGEGDEIEGKYMDNIYPAMALQTAEILYNKL